MKENKDDQARAGETVRSDSRPPLEAIRERLAQIRSVYPDAREAYFALEAVEALVAIIDQQHEGGLWAIARIRALEEAAGALVSDPQAKREAQEPEK